MIDKSIVMIPTLNEYQNLKKLISAIFELMPEISVLIVDDSSKDGTEQLINDLKNTHRNLFLLKRMANFGYGRACVDGFNWAINKDFKYIVTMDADFSHDYRAIPGLVKGLVESDVVIGSRYVNGGKIENWRWHRRILSKAANLYARSILGLKITDLTTGFGAYRSNILFKIDLDSIRSDGYAFLVELKYKLTKVGVRIVEYPITFSERREGQSKMSSKIIWESVKLPWRLRFKTSGT